jgi:hypothetical protein
VFNIGARTGAQASVHHGTANTQLGDLDHHHWAALTAVFLLGGLVIYFYAAPQLAAKQK